MDPLHSFQVDEEGDMELMEKTLEISGGGGTAVPDLSGIRLLVLDFDGAFRLLPLKVRREG